MKTISNLGEFANEVTGQPGVVLVDFFTEGCGPCRMMSPLLAEVANERADLKIVKVDAAVSSDLAAQFRVSAVPTFILFNNGEARSQFTGARTKRDLLSWIDSHR